MTLFPGKKSISPIEEMVTKTQLKPFSVRRRGGSPCMHRKNGVREVNDSATNSLYSFPSLHWVPRKRSLLHIFAREGKLQGRPFCSHPLSLSLYFPLYVRIKCRFRALPLSVSFSPRRESYNDHNCHDALFTQRVLKIRAHNKGANLPSLGKSEKGSSRRFGGSTTFPFKCRSLFLTPPFSPHGPEIRPTGKCGTIFLSLPRLHFVILFSALVDSCAQLSDFRRSSISLRLSSGRSLESIKPSPSSSWQQLNAKPAARVMLNLIFTPIHSAVVSLAAIPFMANHCKRKKWPTAFVVLAQPNFSFVFPLKI